MNDNNDVQFGPSALAMASWAVMALSAPRPARPRLRSVERPEGGWAGPSNPVVERKRRPPNRKRSRRNRGRK